MTDSPRSPVRDRALKRVGQTVRGKLRLDALLGVGGMASVYAATHRNGSRVAIKILHEHVSLDEDIRRLFRREGVAANRIAHPGVVRVIDDDVTEDGCGFLVMPLLVGETLQARLDREGGRLPPAEAMIAADAVLDALAAAHAEGVIHRDIKPDNLFVTESGAIRVLDFGVARVLASKDGGATRAGQAIGTPAYMPPEQALGRTGEVDAQSDVWGVGAVLFRCVAGEYVHGTAAPAELAVLAATKPARLLRSVVPEVAAPLAAVVDRALAFEKRDRWADARAMQSALESAYEAITGHPIAATRELEPPPSSALRRSDVAPDAAAPVSDLHSALTHGAPPISAVADPSARAPAPLAPRRRARVFAVVAALAVLAAALVGVRARHWSPVRLVASESAAPADAGLASASSPAAAALGAGVQAFRDASFALSDAQLRKAIELDPTLATAYLILVLHDLWPTEYTRAWFGKAWQYRSRLEPREAALLEAYQPALDTAPDLAKTASALEAACARYPDYSPCAYALGATQIRQSRLADAKATLSFVLSRDPTFAAAAYLEGRAVIFAGDAPSALRVYRECLRISPYSTGCTEDLTILAANEGECAEVERLARSNVRFAPQTSMAFTYLAGALLARRASSDAVLETLGAGWSVTDEGYRPMKEAVQRIDLAIVEGNLKDAIARERSYEALVHGDTDEAQHAQIAQDLSNLQLELGDLAGAARTAREFTSRREAWTRDAYTDFSILAPRVLYLGGAITASAYDAERTTWLGRAKGDGEAVGVSFLRWLSAYASAVVTPADALAALTALPRFGAPLDPETRDADADLAIGRTYLLAGQLDAARTSLARAARSCRIIEEPLSILQANRYWGEALEKSGDISAACAAYETVLARWGQEPRSRTASFARARASALRCAARDE